MKVITVPRDQVNMDVRKETHVAAALKYIEENLPVGEEGLYGLVNNAGVSSLADVGMEGCHQSHFARCVSAASLTGRLGDRLRGRFETIIMPAFVKNLSWWHVTVTVTVDNLT